MRNDMSAALFKKLALHAPIPLSHRWEPYRRAIIEGELVEASPFGFTVINSLGDQTLEFTDRLSVEHYAYLAPSCTNDGKGLLAEMVVRNFVRPSLDVWMVFKSLFHREVGAWLEDWLPSALEVEGFEKIAAILKEAYAEFEREVPPFSAKPSWDRKRRVFRFGTIEHEFKCNATVAIAILNAMGSNNWELIDKVPVWLSPKKQQQLALREKEKDVWRHNPVHSDKSLKILEGQDEQNAFLKSSQIRDALECLKDISKGYLSWHLSGQGVWLERLN